MRIYIYGCSSSPTSMKKIFILILALKMATAKDVFRISRPPLSERYRITPESITTNSNYSLDVKPRTSAKRPFMVLRDDSKKCLCALVRRPMNSSTFEISLYGQSNASGGKGCLGNEGEWCELTCPTNSTAFWSICLASDETRTFGWVRTSLGLAGRSMKLVDVKAMDGNSVASLKDMPAVATFERRKGWTSFGKIEVDKQASVYGEDFTRMLILTAMCLNDNKSKQATNSAGWGSSGFED